MNKINELKKIINNGDSKIRNKITEIFKDQIEKTDWSYHLTLTEEQFNALDNIFDFRVFEDILVSVEEEGEIDFVHYFYIEDMDSIKKDGLLISHSGKGRYIPDMGHGIYVIKGDSAYDATDEVAEYLLERYDRENAEVGYVEGTYNGKYITCVYGSNHEGYIALKENVTPDMIKNIDSDHISALAEDYYDYITEFDFDFDF